MLNKIVGFKATGPHRLAITFSDGASGEHDFQHVLGDSGPAAEPLRNPDYFKKVFLELGALTWPNGYDMCPDWLRMEMDKAGEIRKPVAAE